MKHLRLHCAHHTTSGIAFGHLCFVSPDVTKLYYMALDDLVTTTERPAGSERLEWKALELERGDPAMNPTVTCWAGPYLFGASDDRLGVLVIDLAKGTVTHTCLRSTSLPLAHACAPYAVVRVRCVCILCVRVRVRVRVGSGRWQPITLVGEPLKIADSGATMCGSPSRLVVFGSAAHFALL
jgi:hypothetical protein